MPYKNCIESNCDGCTQIDSVLDDIEFANIVAEALRNHPDAPPRRKPPLSNALQGNLCEFCIWDIGEKFWQLYDRELTWPTNATNPWRVSSDPGVDILALTSIAEDKPIVLAIEVKSSSSGGSGKIVGGGSSLQTDFKHLMEGKVKTRLQSRTGTLASDLTLKNKRPDLADKVIKAVGASPGDCHGVKIIGVMVCKRGNAHSQSTRLASFQDLQTWLLSQGWQKEQIACYCMEVEDFSEWLNEVIKRAIQ